MAGCLAFPAFALQAQTTAADSTMYRTAVYNAMHLYHVATGAQSGLYNGCQYAQFPFSFAENGHPFFKDKAPGSGSVTYDDVYYENVMLQYDEVQEVIIVHDTSRLIQLLNPRITAFTVYDNQFVRVVKDSLNPVLVRTGFYNVLYNGKVKLLKREEKTIREDVTTGALLRFIETQTYYYIEKDGVYQAIKSKNSINTVFADKRKELRQFAKKNKLNYRKDRDTMLTRLTAYYDQLTN
ncbi:MAG TPA: hypothetical protein VL307_09025 [Chitinophagaceae bacterium]|nr:hypothetical protein [Chitinophagaceae bacterium]